MCFVIRLPLQFTEVERERQTNKQAGKYTKMKKWAAVNAMSFAAVVFKATSPRGTFGRTEDHEPFFFLEVSSVFQFALRKRDLNTMVAAASTDYCYFLWLTITVDSFT